MGNTTDLAQAAPALLRRCRSALNGMKHGLSSVMQGRERDFLALGENLMSLQAGCEELSAKAQALVELTSDQARHLALDSLSTRLKSITDIDAHDASRQSLEEIDGVSRIVEELSGIVAAFAKIVKHLSMLGIATRIESARLGADGRGFSTLADDVEKLAHAIVDHCAGIAGRIEALRGHVASARERTLAIIKAQQQCFATIDGQLEANIQGLGELAERSAALSRDLSGSAAKIAADISQAVQSLQSHDIVRQQIEHVEHALADMVQTLDGQSATQPGSGENPLDLVAFAADILTLQISQLDSADRHFAEAANTLRGTLLSLSSRILDIGQSIAEALGGGGPGQDTPLARVGAGVASVKAQLGDFAAQGEALGGIMDSVAQTISDMGGSIEAIEEVGAEIELIALNASIKAAHTGSAGAALGVLASAIQHLSADARRQTDAVARILGDISSASSALQENAARYNDQSEAWHVVEELDTVLADMTDTANRGDALFTDLSATSARLGAQARDLGQGIVFDQDVGGRLAAIRATLQEQADQARQLVPDGGQGRSASLRALYDRYTMEAERAVHEAAFGLTPAKAGGAAAGPAGPAQEDAGEFGDNVELF